MKSKKLKLVVLLVVCGLFLGTAFEVMANPWSMYHADAGHTNHSPHTGPTMPGLLWQGPSGPMGPLHTNTGTAVGADGTIYVGGWDGNLYALNPDGTIKGIFDGSAAGLTNAGICCGAPIIGPDGTIYVSGRYTWALNPDLTIKWQQTYYSGLCCGSLTVGPDGTLYRGEWGLPLMAYDAATGAVKWTFSEGPGEWFTHSPALNSDGSTAYVTTQHTLYAVNTADGSMEWSYPIDNPGFGAPAVAADDKIYVASGQTIVVFSKRGPDNKGNPNRVIQVGSNVFEIALDPDGSIACVTFDTVTEIPGTGSDAGIAEDARDGSVHMINADGSIRWSAPFLGNAQPNYMTQFAPVLDANGNVYILTREYDWRDRSNDVSPAFLYGFSSAGTLLFLEALPPATGTYAYEGPTQVTIAADGTLYASWFGGYVYAFGSVEISATCASGSVTISGAGFGTNEPGTGVSYTETVCTGKGKKRTCTDETTDCPVISWYDAEIVADCGICPATVDVVTVTDSFSVDVTSDGGGGDPPANCGDYTDEGSCTAAGCNWNANKGMCK